MKTSNSIQPKSGWAEVLLKNIGDAILAVDIDLRITFINEAAENLLGVRLARVQGMLFHDLIKLTDETNGEAVTLPLASTLENREYYSADQGLLMLDTTGTMRRIHASASPVQHKQGGIIGSVIQLTVFEADLGTISDHLQKKVEYHMKTQQLPAPDFFFVKKDGTFFKVLARDIRWIEAMENYAILVTSQERFIVHSTLKRLASSLRQQGFVRVHRSFIVPVDKIDSIEDNRLRIGETEIPIGKSYRSQLMSELHFI